MAKATDSKGKRCRRGQAVSAAGYHGTALHDNSDRWRLPRGSLYFHFPKGKEQIGAAALTLAGEAVRRPSRKPPRRPRTPKCFSHGCRGMAADLEQSDYKEGCRSPHRTETAAQSEVLGAATRSASRNGAEINAGSSASACPRATRMWPRPRVLASSKAAVAGAHLPQPRAAAPREQAVKLLVRGRAGE